MAVAGLDVSNWQGEVTAERARCWADVGIGHVVVRASLEDMPRVNLARRQIAALRDAGIDVSVYLWLYPLWDPAKTVADAMREYGPLDIKRWWVDVEEMENPAPPSVQIPSLHATLKALTAAGRVAGVYSAAWYWNDPAYMGGTRDFAGYPLWLAYYDGDPNINRWVGFGGWAPGTPNVIGKQYTGTGALCGLSPLDCNTFLDSVIVRPKPEPGPEPDDRDERIRQLSAALAITADSWDAEALTLTNAGSRARQYAVGARDAAAKWGM